MELKAIIFAAFLGLAVAKPSPLSRSKVSKLTADLGEGGGKLGIYKGKTTTIEKHPYLASIHLNGAFYCAGAILSENWIITLGDATYGFTKDDLTVVTGSSDGTNGTEYKVKNIVRHPKYTYEAFYYYDYALLEIKGKFTWGSKVANISLPSQKPPYNKMLIVAGYGKSSPEDDGYKLLQGKMKLLPNATCAQEFETDLGWSDSELCVYNLEKATICEGDYGDPFVYDGVLYGLALGGFSENFCTSLAYPTIVANIYLVKDWIQKHTGATISQH